MFADGYGLAGLGCLGQGHRALVLLLQEDEGGADLLAQVGHVLREGGHLGVESLHGGLGHLDLVPNVEDVPRFTCGGKDDGIIIKIEVLSYQKWKQNCTL